MNTLLKSFKESFGHTPTAKVRAPGRLELLGNHTDYNEGLVMSLAIDRYITMAAAPRTDGVVDVVSANDFGRETFRLTDIKKNPDAAWADYIKGVLLQLQKRGIPVRGMSVAVHGTIPAGAGLSSSAALEVATALMARELFPFTLTDTGTTIPPERNSKGELPPLTAKEKLNFAKLCNAAESEFVGVKCGLLDQISSLFGQAFHAMSIDCRFQTVEHAPMIGDISVVVCNSGVKHELVDGGYNELRRLCEAAAHKLGASALRSVQMKDLQAQKDKLTEREFDCAYHVVGEIQRVVFGERSLREGDFVQFGQFMYQSHESSRDYFKNSCEELDILVDLARKHSGCLGARLSGGGFGGATVNLVRSAELEEFKIHMAVQFEKATGLPLNPMVVQVADGAGAG